MKTVDALREKKDLRWAAFWGAGVSILGLWDLAYLNTPALKQVAQGYLRTLVIAGLAAGFTLGLGWAFALGLHFSQEAGRRRARYFLGFLLNLFRSVPQVVGILFCYVAAARLFSGHGGSLGLLLLLALGQSLFIFPEAADLIAGRIAHFQTLDFCSAMRVCGMGEGRIVNFHILWKNSRAHLLNKLISVFGMAVFLQCSVDFIISVGLSQHINALALPPTLGSLLAKLDSKQDILAIGFSLTHPAYLPELLFTHLQGLSVAILIVFTLLCVDQISKGFTGRHRI